MHIFDNEMVDIDEYKYQIWLKTKTVLNRRSYSLIILYKQKQMLDFMRIKFHKHFLVNCEKFQFDIRKRLNIFYVNIILKIKTKCCVHLKLNISQLISQ